MDSFDVMYQNKPVGKVTLRPTPGGIRFDAVCQLTGEPLLRLYGVHGSSILPIGVLTPYAGYWHIGRTLSRQSIRDAGFGEELPVSYLLSERPPAFSQTGDDLIDAVLQTGAAQMVRTDDYFEVSCAFDSAQPSPLAFALAACSVKNGRATLRIKT